MSREPFNLTDGNRLAYFSVREWEAFVDLRAGFTKRISSRNKVLLWERERALLVHEGFSLPRYSVSQAHGNSVGVVRRGEKRGKRFLSDALVTSERDIALFIHAADCVPVYFFDPASLCIGVAHAGWRGTVLKICSRVVETLTRTYGASPRTVLSAIGPSIKSCCYDVREDVLSAFAKTFPSSCMRKIFTRISKERWRCDLTEANRLVLEESGVPRKNILTSARCTFCEEKNFYSYRRENGRTGRMMAFIGLLWGAACGEQGAGEG